MFRGIVPRALMEVRRQSAQFPTGVREVAAMCALMSMV
jgi:hypothetical protein